MKLFFSLLLLTCYFTCSAQDFNFGDISVRDIRMAKDSVDSISNAVVLDEYGEADLQYDLVKGLNEIIFYYHTKIKLFNKDGYSNSEIIIPLYKSENNYNDNIYNIEAYTYNITNEKIEKIKVPSKNIYREELNKNITLVKFTFPDLKEGAIIEYSYRKVSPRIFNFQTWEFQDNIPKLRSCFRSRIPDIFEYSTTMKGYYSLSNATQNILYDNYQAGNYRSNSKEYTYSMYNIPAFIEESYMTAASNFKSAIYYELKQISYSEMNTKKFTTSWPDIEKLLRDDDNFGRQLRKNIFKKEIPIITANGHTDLDKAKSIYNYIRSQIKWNDNNNLYSIPSIEDAFKKHTGSAGDINLALINALKLAGIPTEPLILSTRNNGVPNLLFPVISDYNYVIARAKIGNDIYYLDATEPYIAFGILPFRCLNGTGRVVPTKGDSYEDSIPIQNAKSTYYFTGKLNTDGKLEGNLKITSRDFNAFLRRKEIKKYETPDDFVDKSLLPTLGNVKVKNISIAGVDTTDEDITETYDIEQSIFDSPGTTLFNFNSYMFDKTSKNPFNQNERTYPVDLGVKNATTVLIDIALPDSFTLGAYPKDIRLELPNKDALFYSYIKLENGHLKCNYTMQINKTIFLSEYYPLLKEFFSRIIQLEKADIFIKKL